MHRLSLFIAASACVCPLPAMSSTAVTATAAAARHVLPDYAPVERVVISESLITDGYESLPLLKALVHAQAKILILSSAPRPFHVVAEALRVLPLSGKERARIEIVELPHEYIWIRDFGPIAALQTGARDQAPALTFIDLKYAGSPQDDAVPGRLAAHLKTPLASVPLTLDGGNFLVAGQTCITSFTAPPASPRRQLPAALLDVVKGPHLLKERFASAVGCDKVVVLENPPHEHVDMWIKPVADDILLVNELKDTALAAYKTKHGTVPPEWLELKRSLDVQAAQLSRSFKVTRVPMPVPYRGTFRTYTNSLLINGMAIVPQYKRYGWNYEDYPDKDLLTGYEAEVTAIYRDLGYAVRFVNADSLVFNGGVFHCVAVQIPKIQTTPKI